MRSSNPHAQRARARAAKLKTLLAVLVPVFLVTNWAFNDQFPVVASFLQFLVSFGLPRVAWTILFCGVSVSYLIRAYLTTQMDAYGKVKSDVQAGPSIGSIAGWFGSKDAAQEAQAYTSLFSEKQGGDVHARKSKYMELVNAYYNLATDFYEYGWGKSFHFGRRFTGEEFHASIARHEHWLAARAGFQPKQTIIDLGCGVGGPMRAIARFTGAKVIGINNNAYQIKRGTVQNMQAGLADLCSFQQADFMNLPFKDGSIDGAYAIEATCHAPDKTALFREILRVLKPGAVFAGYEWCVTDKYDAKNAEHRQIKYNIEIGDGLPDLAHTSDVDRALVDAGFELVEAEDISPVTPQNDVAWYATMESDGLGLKNFRHSRLGIWLTHQMCRVLEFCRLAPKGTTKTHEFLTKAPKALVAGGKTGVFTPMYYFKAVKPLK